jgi:hypothetical protein
VLGAVVLALSRGAAGQTTGDDDGQSHRSLLPGPCWA